KIVGTIATAGTVAEAQSAYAIGMAVVNTLNSIDDVGQNKNGEGLLEQNVSNSNLKDVIKNAKMVIYEVQSDSGVAGIIKTIESPFQIYSTASDLNTTINNINQFPED